MRRIHRRGFTIVELLVAMALVVLIMAILSEAFAAGLEAFRELKAIGDMDGRLQSVSTVMRRDLIADHFEGKKRLSDASFWNDGPPREGYFRLWHAAPRLLEGLDADGNPSFRTADHALQFTVKLRGNQRGDFFSSQVPPLSPLLTLPTDFFGFQPDAKYQDTATTFNSQWAEIAYYLRPNGTSAAGTPLFALYRRQRLAVPNSEAANELQPVLMNNAVQYAAQLANYAEVSCVKRNPAVAAFPDVLHFNTPTDLTIPARRFGMAVDPNPVQPPSIGGVWPPAWDPRDAGFPTDAQFPQVTNRYPEFTSTTDNQNANPNANLAGADAILTDVVSFEVTALVAGGVDFVDLYDVGFNPVRFNSAFYRPVSAPNTNLNGPAVFDTWSNARDEFYNYSYFRDQTGNEFTIWNTPGSTRSAPLNGVRILALRITLRVWDLKTQLTRQVTITQEM
jgi:prepilin-type N-terminal cleavage/methylation domain-containing protein